MSPVVLGGSQSGAIFSGPLVPGAAGSLALLAGSGRGAGGGPGGRADSVLDPADIRPRGPLSPRAEAEDDLYH